MGYESTLLIGVASDLRWSTDDNTRLLQIVAQIDLSKMGSSGPFAALTRIDRNNRPKLEFHAYVSDSNSSETEDKYGDPLVPLDLDEVIAALEAERDQDYRRIRVALGLLRSFRDNREQWPDNLTVVHYGH